jgi:hypothetical protein
MILNIRLKSHFPRRCAVFPSPSDIAANLLRHREPRETRTSPSLGPYLEKITQKALQLSVP